MADKVPVVFAAEYFLEEVDTEEEDDNIVPHFLCSCMRRNRVPSVRIFYEDVWPDFSYLDFSKHFRLSKQTFTGLFQEIENDFAKKYSTTRKTTYLDRETGHGLPVLFM